MSQAQMKYRGYSILCRAVGSVGKLERIKHRRESWKDVVLHQPLEALHHYRRECNRTIIIKAFYCGFFGHWYYNSSLKTWWNNSLIQWDVKNICKYRSQLVSAFLQHPSWYIIRTRCLLCVNFSQNKCVLGFWNQLMKSRDGGYYIYFDAQICL